MVLIQSEHFAFEEFTFYCSAIVRSFFIIKYKILMQPNQQTHLTRNLINSNFLPDYENSTSTKTFKQPQFNTIKSPPVSPRTISPMTQMIEIKNIKNDQFLFRMKLKLIACMQQLEISKEDIEALRKQQGDAQVLSSFITPIKKEFAVLKKLKEQYLLKQSKQVFSMKSINNMQSLQIISLQSQLQQMSEAQKKLKHRCQRLFTQNAQLIEKLKKKQHEYEESQNTLYQTKLLLKEYESVIENLKISAKKVQKDFVTQKDRMNEQLNAFKELMVREREAKQIYLSKLDHLETTVIQKEDTIKRFTQQSDFLKKECIKWKTRSQWRQGQANQQTRMHQQKLKSLQQQIQKLRDIIKSKQSQIMLTKKQASNSAEVFNKKLEKIVEEWKAKLIDTIEEYEGSVEGYVGRLKELEGEVQRLKGVERELKVMTVEKDGLIQELSTLKLTVNEKEQKITSLQGQLKDSLTFYTQKIKQLQSILTLLKSQNLTKSLSINQSITSLSQLNHEIKEKQTQNQKLRSMLVNKENELGKINQAKKETEKELLRRISMVENNRIVEVSKLKVQCEENVENMEKEVKRLRVQLQKYEKYQYRQQQIRVIPKTPHQNYTNNNNNQSPQKPTIQNFSQQSSLMKSSSPSVNNSFNMGLGIGVDRSNDRTNRLISETYVEPQKKSSVRRIFVRSNSINDYLREKMASEGGGEEGKDKINGNGAEETFLFSSNRQSNVHVIGKAFEQQQ